MSNPQFFTLELIETRKVRLTRPEVQTFYYVGLHYGFTIYPAKAMRFDTHKDAYDFIQKHGLYGFEVVHLKLTEKDQKCAT